MSDALPENPPSINQAPEDDISLLELAIVVAKHKWLVLGLPLMAGVGALIFSLLLPNIYTATTRILPPQPSQSTASALLGQLGNLSGVLGGPSGGSRLISPSDLYVAMLRSRTVADNLIQRFDLMKVYEEKYISNARKQLGGDSHISASRGDNVIVIEVDDKDPKRAADIANAYVEELFKLTKVLALTEASQRRVFFEQQFLHAKDNLAKVEIETRQALQKGGLVKVDDQGRAMVETTARLRAQITVKEVQIGAMRTFAADRNPELRLAQQEVESLKSELAKTEGVGDGKVRETASNGKGLDNLRLLRDLKYYEFIYEMLARQFEIAKIDEARDSTVIQVIDRAVEPDRKSRPKRAVIVLVTGITVGLIAILMAFIIEALARSRRNPVSSKRLQVLRNYLRLK